MQNDQIRKKVLVLGAGGFIGSHIVIALLRTGRYTLTGLDVTRDKLDEGFSQASALLMTSEDRSQLDEVAYVDLDLMDPTNDARLAALIDSHDVVVNLVAICNPSLYVKDPLLTFEVGFMANLKVVRMCANAHTRLIQFSTSEVYGKSPAVYVKDTTFLFNEEHSNLIMGRSTKAAGSMPVPNSCWNG